MSKTISVGWYRQNSGRYALKGITIYEDARAYDSTGTFRDEDAQWLTKILGAKADVEISGNRGRVGERSREASPEWALDMRQEANSDGIPPLELERAGAALLRHFLARMIEAANTGAAGAEFEKLASEANAALLATGAGTYYTLDEALTLFAGRSQKPGSIRSKR